MNKARYVVRLSQQEAVVIETSVGEENCNLSLIDWVKRVRSDDDSAPCVYRFKWHHGDNINVDYCELYGKFIRETDRGATISMNLCVGHYPVVYYTMEEFMKLFRIGNSGWCLSGVINVL